MNILIVTHYFLPHKGGLEFVVYNQAKELAKRGHEITVLTSKLADEPKEEIMDGFKIKRINVCNLLERKWGVPYPIYNFSILHVFNKEIKNSDLVYIHDIFYMPCYFAAFFANIHNKPIVLMEHVRDVNHSKKIVNLVQKIVMKTFGKYVLNSSDKVIVCNTEVGKWLCDNFNKTKGVVFIKNAVDTNLFKPTTKENKIKLRKKYKLPLNKPIVLFAGRLYEVKGFDRLFNARDNRYLIVFVGKGNITKEMENDKNTKFVGAVSQDNLVEFYQLSDMFCLPSRHEGFPLSILESLACGIPVISSNLPGYNKYIESKDAILIDSSNVENIRNAILFILKNKEKYESLQKYYRDKAVKEFDWKANVDKLEKTFRQVIKQNENKK